MKQYFGFIFLAILLAAATSLAMERFGIVTTQELASMLEDRAAGRTDFILVNTLEEMIFKNGSIPGSINVPWGKVKEVSDRLGNVKERLIITY